MLTKLDRDVTIRVSDGTQLCADIYRPAAEGKYPVIVTRTPYLKETERFVVRAHYFAESGYVYIIQDVRGCGKSEGSFYPFFNEAMDGYDTLTWAAKQNWSTGSVATIGASYGAWTQWLCAKLTHPNLVTMISEASPPDFFQCLPYQNGAFSLPLLSWLVQLDGYTDRGIHEIDWENVLRARPLNLLDRLCGRQIQAWQDWLEHDREDSYWGKIAFNRNMKQIKLPVFHISGWYDDVLVGTLINYSGMCDGRRARGGRYLQKLLIGPWPHRINTTSRFGLVDFGEQGIIDLFAIQREWFDYWLKGSSTAVLAGPPVRFYVMEANEWMDASEWPPSQTQRIKLYLRSLGAANTKWGKGRLDTRPPGSEAPDEYLYDPRNPVPFLTDPGWIQLGGPDDYSLIEDRDDVLVYSTEPLHQDVVIAGPITVNLFAASSAADTDFTAKLLDARPDGYVMRLNDGIIRARFRKSRVNPTAIVPNRVYKYQIDCWASSYVFRKRHCIRLEISSSAFPKFDPNLNSGHAIASDESTTTATQRVYHDAEHPSHVVLSVIGQLVKKIL